MDPLFPPPSDFISSRRNIGDLIPEILFEKVFDEALEGNIIKLLLNENKDNILFEASEKDEILEKDAKLFEDTET